jgi:hypothetical protein
MLNEVEKEKKKTLCREIKRMWNVKCMIIPVVTGATGIVAKGFKKNLEAMPRKNSIVSLQKTAMLGKSHTIRKVLQSETRSLSGKDHRLFKRSARNKSLVTRVNIIIIIIIIIIDEFHNTERYVAS